MSSITTDESEVIRYADSADLIQSEPADEEQMELAGPIEAELAVPEKIGLRELTRMEKTIRQGLSTFRTVGETLRIIRDRKLYQLRNYRTFKEYCEQEFQMSKAHCYHLIAHVELCRELGVSPEEVPEKALRSLSVIKDKEERLEIWEEAKEAGNGACPARSRRPDPSGANGSSV